MNGVRGKDVGFTLGVAKTGQEQKFNQWNSLFLQTRLPKTG